MSDPAERNLWEPVSPHEEFEELLKKNVYARTKHLKDKIVRQHMKELADESHKALIETINEWEKKYGPLAR